MRMIVGAVLAAAVTGCATAPQHPSMRPLSAAHIETMGPTRVVLSENNNGVEKSWFFTSTQSAGAAYGLVGVLVSAAMDAIINAGPAKRAQRAADEMAELFPADTLNASLLAHLNAQTPAEQAAAAEAAARAAAEAAAAQAALTAASATPGEAPAEAVAIPVAVTLPAPSGVYYDGVESAQRLTVRDALDDAVEINVRYTLSEDSSTLRVIAAVSYQSAQTPYATPYTFENSVPRTEREGPAYRNTFTYYSSQLEVPTLTPELRERLVESIQESARDEAGNLPTEGSEFQSMQRELTNARDDNLSKDEIAIFLTREWLRDDGARLRREIEQAHAFIARYVVLDMNRTATPSLAGQDELIETAADNRTVRRIGATTEAGAYVSSAANVTSFSTYGNTISIARVHNERIDAVRSAARRTR